MHSWIDAHCHLADPRLDADRAQVLERSRAQGVVAWVQGGVSPDDWEKQHELLAQFGDAIVPVLGIHPWWVAEADEAAIEAAFGKLAKLLPQARALGELGLDALPRHAETLDRQQVVFERQLELAQRHQKPIVLHIVHAHEAAVKTLKKFGPYPHGGLVHAFSASIEVARPYLELGFHISVGSGLLREGFAALKKALPFLPADRLLIETDAPDGLPKTRNEPANLVRVAEAAAALRGEEAEAILDRSAEQVRRLFGIGT